MWNFMNTEWFVPEPDNWHIKANAPQEIKDEFAEYQKQEEEAKKKGIILN